MHYFAIYPRYTTCLSLDIFMHYIVYYIVYYIGKTTKYASVITIENQDLATINLRH